MATGKAVSSKRVRGYEEWRTLLRECRLPAAIVDLDAFDANATALLNRAGTLPLRVASKSIRCRALLERVLASQERFRGILCFTADEAVWLSQQGLDDLLVAYPGVDRQQIENVCRAIDAGHRITLTVDCAAHLEHLNAIAGEQQVVLPVSIEIDLSLRLPGLNFGVWRSPVRQPDALLALAQAVEALPHLRLAGLMGYEAQLAGVTDAAPGAALKNQVIRLLKRWSETDVRRRRDAMLRILREHELQPEFVNAGGTGCLEFSAAPHGATEVTAGSGLYSPGLFDDYQDFRHRPAAFFALPVVRKPAPGMVTCLGGGYVASGAAGGDRLPSPWLPDGARLTKLEAAGEVQTPVLYTGPHTLDIGDPVLFRHAKAGELCERFNTLLLVSGDRIVDEVPTYRGEGQCFL